MLPLIPVWRWGAGCGGPWRDRGRPRREQQLHSDIPILDSSGLSQPLLPLGRHRLSFLSCHSDAQRDSVSVCCCCECALVTEGTSGSRYGPSQDSGGKTTQILTQQNKKLSLKS
ncbi:hypothetical protein E2C01_095759 [Portunus trituberculatus]|uniref:Uncharacterized protein n=1 Tax=Portunus trituberculatus TaxID=210409 RepID=A0A5B7K186_PORTR|nr:hypothetical protein [Portunus trituberculatus]